MKTAASPICRSHLITSTPTDAPEMPPASSTRPILTSTLPKRKWAAIPEEDAATIWQESLAAATVAGIPIMIRIGVIRKPPPTPRRPERNPTSDPTPASSNKETLWPATGSSTCTFEKVLSALVAADPARRA